MKSGAPEVQATDQVFATSSVGIMSVRGFVDDAHIVLDPSLNICINCGKCQNI